MKVPGIWKGLGWFLVIIPLMGLFGLLKIIVEIGIGYTFAVLGLLMWLSLLSVVFSIVVGVLLIRGSIWGYYLTKVLMVISVINIVFLLFDFDLRSFVSLIFRLIILSKVIYADTTNLYLSELRSASKN